MESHNQPNIQRAVPLVRCSTLQQADTSIPDQLKSIRSKAAELGIGLLPAHEMPGVSGSIQTNVENGIQAIIDRKSNGEPIDAIMVFDLSRLGRSGSYHLGKIMTMMQDAGITLIESIDDLGDSEFAPMFHMIKAETNHRQAKSNAMNSARGSRTSLEDGRRTFCTRAPYGIDREYLNSAGQPLYIMRDLGHHVRAMLDPQTGNEIKRYEKKERFKKDKQDRVVLIPGDPQRQAIVRRVFELYFLKRIGTFSIAKMLNDEGTPAPRGGLWSSSCIQAMLRCPAYLGFGLASFRANGVYCKQSAGLPEPLKKNYGKKLKQIRPREDWYRVDCPELEEYLPPEVRPLALEHLNKYLDRFEHGHVPKSKPINPKLGASERSMQFPLAGILKERTTGSEMRGSSSASRKYAYYRISRSHLYHSSAKQHMKRALPAKPIHRAVLEEIEQLICNAPDLRPILIDEIMNQDKQRGGSQDEVEQLKKELHALDRKAESLLDQLEGEFAEQAKSKLQKAKSRKREIIFRLDEIDQGPRMSEPDIEQMADGIIADMADLLDLLTSMQSSDIRQVFALLIDEAVCDLEKREVSFSLAIPASMLSQRDLCPPVGSGPKSCYRTKKWTSIRIQTVTIELPGSCHAECQRPFKPKGCNNCRRKRKAA